MKSTTLIKAIEIITKKFNNEVISIEYKDGTPYKFNYVLKHEYIKKFINLEEDFLEIKSHENLPETL